jgi:DDE family transposase
MTTFDELLAPAMPIIQQIEHDRPKHHNEDLTWSAFVRILVYFFTKDLLSGNELIVSLQSADPNLGLPKASRRALSEGFWRFSPNLLQHALTTYLATYTYPGIPELSFIGSTYAVDGSLFPLIQSIYWPKTRDVSKNVKLHLKFSLTSAIAVEFVLGDEHSSERAAFRAMTQPGQTYVLDRGYMEYQLVKDVDDRGAWLVVRAYNNIEVETIEELPVILPDALNNHWTNVHDRIVRPKDPEFAHISFRLVECTVGTTTYRLITNLYQLTTFQILLLYAYRWQIELIFRYLKHTMHGVHIITQNPIGMQNCFYALVLTALLHLHLKQRCLAEEGYDPPQSLPTSPQQPDERNVQISDDGDRPTNHLAIARFFARLNDALTRFWKISKHWLHTLADNLSRPYTADIVHLLNKYAV